MKYLFLFIAVVCVAMLALQCLVMAGHLLLWSLQLGLPVIALIACVILYFRYRRR